MPLIPVRRRILTPVAAACVGAGGGGGGGAFTFLNSDIAFGTNGGTSSGIDTTGATDIVAAVAWATGTTEPTLSDSKSNTWTPKTSGNSGTLNLRFHFVHNPTTDAAHTFTIAAASSFSVLGVLAFAGGTNSSPFDQESVATGFSNAAQSGSITPSANNEVLVAAVSGNASSVDSIDGSFVHQLNIDFFGEKLSVAYLIQTSAAAANPTWSLGSTVAWVANILSLKQS
jgi:hypothetical protein